MSHVHRKGIEPGLSKILLAWLSDDGDGDTGVKIGQVGHPRPARQDKVDGDRLSGDVAGERLPVCHRVLFAPGHVDHQLGEVQMLLKQQSANDDEEVAHRQNPRGSASFAF